MPPVGLDNVVPYDEQAERAVLAAVIADPRRIEELISALGEDAFYLPLHRTLFNIMVSIYSSGQSLTLPRIIERLKATEIYSADVYEYVMDLGRYFTSYAEIAAMWDGYIEILREKMTLRRIMAAGQEIIKLAQEAAKDPSVSVKDVVDKAEALFLKYLDTGFGGDIVHIKDALLEFLDIATLVSSGQKRLVIPTGIADLDDILNGGLGRSDLIIVAARPSVGKTALALQIALNIAREGHGVLFFSLEMPAVQIAVRAISNVSGINAMRILRSGFIDQQMSRIIADFITQLEKYPLYIDDTSGLTVFDIKSRARKLHHRLQSEGYSGLGLVVVDYLQLMRGLKGFRNRVQEIGQMTMELKQLARELDIPVLVVSQLSREVERRQDKRPILSDLRESGSIEQDADVVMLLWREDYYERPEEDRTMTQIHVDVAKHRHGKTGKITLTFEKDTMRFYQIESSGR